LELVDKTRPYRLRGEFRTVNSDVVLGVGLEPPDCARIEFTLDSRPRAAWAKCMWAGELKWHERSPNFPA
jgi:hypothetical protein